MAVMRQRRRFTLAEYHRMGQAGILDEDERVELIAGEIVRMAPIGRAHASAVARISKLFEARFGERAVVWAQNPLALPRQVSELQPDVALLRPRRDFYRGKRVLAADVLLLVEVMDSSVAVDRRVKLPLYASAGVREVWLADVRQQAIEVYRAPGASGSRDRRRLDRAGALAPLAFPSTSLAVRELLG